MYKEIYMQKYKITEIKVYNDHTYLKKQMIETNKQLTKHLNASSLTSHDVTASVQLYNDK